MQQMLFPLRHFSPRLNRLFLLPYKDNGHVSHKIGYVLAKVTVGVMKHHDQKQHMEKKGLFGFIYLESHSPLKETNVGTQFRQGHGDRK